jgi:hypothetical protein
MDNGMIAEAYKLAERLNDCEPYFQLDQITFIEAANLLVKMADQNQLLNKLTKNDKFH